MRSVRTVLLLACGCLMGSLTGCHTASGRAIENRFGSAISELLGGAQKLVSAEGRRSGRLLRYEPLRTWSPQQRVASLIGAVRQTVQTTSNRLGILPAQLTGLSAKAVHNTVARVRALADGESRMARNHRPGVLLARLRRGVAKMIRRSDFAKPILGGPGDPDRTTDPDMVRRQETWVERLLRRF